MWIEQTWKRRLLYLLAPVAPVACSKYLFKQAFGRSLDLAHPTTLDEKIMWLKLNRYRNDPLVALCADKWREMCIRDRVDSLKYEKTRLPQNR